MIWMLRLSLVGLTAAAMALVGSALLPDLALRPSGYVALAAISAALWLGLSPLVYRQGLGMAISVGLMSPLIPIALGMPIAILALLDIRYWTMFPTGALTGVLVWASLSIGNPARSERWKR
jgi:hypothetical protein